MSDKPCWFCGGRGVRVTPDATGECIDYEPCHHCDAFDRKARSQSGLRLTELPYAGTSGWSGSDASRERAESLDSSGKTTDRQERVLRAASTSGTTGVTWQDVADLLDTHHGGASNVLSVLHKAGRLSCLLEKRNRCHVYVLPMFVNGRDTRPHGRKPKLCAKCAAEITEAS